ncbi:auxilin-related protein 2 isoform X2 [Capsella rubella]|uniref:auxilin-related protein 2 isoform X2 n=1 Tax=Capsella rubella TaxID=81985 RepID=UPI000CD59722|nr:auxilin-related protein 2 isoform X2 [Capsella rubella]
MDEFGVLTERYGIKPQGKSAPMAASKRSGNNNPPNNNNAQSWNFATASSSGVNGKSKSTSFSGNGSVYDGDDIFFTSSSTNIKGSNSSSGFDDFDVFSGLSKSKSSLNDNYSKSSLNDDLLFSNFGNSGNKSSSPAAQGFDADDLFGGVMPGSNSSSGVKNDDLFGSFASSEKQYATAVDDLLGLGKNAAGYDGLIPGFGGSTQTTSSKTTTSNFDAADPFVVLESTTSAAHSSSGLFVDPLEEFAASVSSQGKKPSNISQTSSKLKPPPKPTQKVDRVKSSGMSSIDELEDFAMGTMRRSASASDTASKYREAEDAGTKKKEFGVDDLDSFFSAGPRSSSVPKSRTTTETTRKQAFNVPKKTANGVSSVKKPPPPANLVDDFSALFGEDPMFKQFEEIPGETEERRKARWDREQRTKSRVMISETVDSEIRRWATGKEGNMRALLSSLQIVLWPGCGWEAVSLTDLITSSAVKKVYRKATLYVHPDKVQQKGATLEQKYIAEKVFDILKEAWNKFNKEELS